MPTKTCSKIILSFALAWLALAAVPGASAANTADNYTGAASATLLNTTYWSLAAYPLVGNDAVFTASSGTGTHALTAATWTVGSFDVTATTGTFVINNQTTTTTDSILTLGGAGAGDNSVSGTAADLLYVASGATFNLLGVNGSSGSGVLKLALGQSGNFNAVGTMSISSAISGSTFGITKTGAGTLTLNGSAVSTFNGGLTINSGTLTLDYANYNGNDLLNSGNALTLGGGTLSLLGNTTASAANSQTFASTTLNSGYSPVLLAKGSSATSVTLNLGQVTLNPGGVTVFTPTTSWTTTLSATEKVFVTSGGSITVPGSGTAWTRAGIMYGVGGTRWAQVDSSRQLLGAPSSTAITATSASSTTVHNYNITGDTTFSTLTAASYGLLLSSATSTRTLYIPNGGTYTLNGIIGIGSAASVIAPVAAGSGKVVIGAEKDFVINMTTASGFTISAPIDNNSGVASSLTVNSTSTGTTTLSGANTYTGTTTVNAGTLNLGLANTLNSASSIVVNGGTLGISTYNQSVSAVKLTGGTISGTSPATLTSATTFDLQNGSISAILAGLTGSVGATKTTAGTVTLSGANTFNGGLTVNGGTVSFASDGNTGGTGYPLGVYPNSFSATAVTLNGGGLLDTTTATIDVNRGITLGASGGTLDAPSSQTLTVNSIIAGNGRLTKGTGAGALTLAGANTFNSGLTVNGGVVNFSSDGTGSSQQLGAYPGSVTADAIILNGGKLNDTATTAISVNRGITLGSSGGTLDASSGQTLTVNSAIAGNGNLTKGATTSTLTLAGNTANTYSGTTYLNGVSGYSNLQLGKTGGVNAIPGNLQMQIGSILQLNSSEQIADTGILSLVAGGGGTYAYFRLNGFNETVAGVSTVSGNFVIENNSASANTSILTINNASPNTYSLSCFIRNNSAGSSIFGITKQGSGTLTFGGVNVIYTGATTIHGGTLELNGATGFASPVTFDSGSSGTLQIAGSGGTGTIKDLSTADVPNNNVYVQNAVGYDEALTINQSGSTTFGGIIRDNTGGNKISITKSGGGTLTLANANTFSGGITLSAGTLNINNAQALGTVAGTLAINGGTIDNSSAADITTLNYPLTLGGDFVFTGTKNLNFGSGTTTLGTAAGTSRTITTTANTLTLGGSIGNGTTANSIIKAGAGTLSLAGAAANTYSALTTVSAGTLQLAKSGAVNAIAGGGLTIGAANNTAATVQYTGASSDMMGAGTVTINGRGILDFNGDSDTIGNVAIVSTGATGSNPTPIINTAGGGNLTIGTLGITPVAGFTSVVNSGSGTLTLGGDVTFTAATTGQGQISGKLDVGSATRNFTVNLGTGSGYDLWVDAVMSSSAGTYGLTKAGTGRLTLSGANTYSGATTLSAGTTQIGLDNGIGSVVGAITSSPLGIGTLTFNGGTLSSDSTTPRTILNAVSFTGNAGLGDSVNNGKLTFSAGLNLGSTARTITVNSDVQIDGGLSSTVTSGTVGLTKSGSGKLTLTAANISSYVAATTVTAGTLAMANVAAFGPSSQINFGGATLQLATDSSVNACPVSVGTSTTGILVLDRATAGAGFTETLGNLFMGITSTLNVTKGANVTSGTPVASFATLSMSSGSGAGVSTIVPTTASVTIAGKASATTSGNKTLTLDGTITGNSINGNIENGSSTVLLVKANSSTWTLNGVANTYSGSTTISGGTLALGTGATIPNTPTISVAAGATFDVTTPGLTLGVSQVLTGAGTVSGAVTSNGKITPGTSSIGTLTIGALTLNAGSTLDCEFTASTGTPNDLVNVTTSGGLTLNGGAINLYVVGGTTAFTIDGTYNLFQHSGALGGTGLGALTVANPVAGKTYLFGDTGTYVTITIGDSINWAVDSDGSWITAGDWNPATVPNATGTGANFDDTVTTFTAPHIVTLDGAQSVGALSFNCSQSFTINAGSSGSLVLDNGPTAATLAETKGSHAINAPVSLSSIGAGVSVASATTLSLNGAISGSGALTKSSTGTLTLSGGANTYGGATTINGGTVSVGVLANGGTASDIGSSANAAANLVFNGGTLKYTGAAVGSDRLFTVGTAGATLDASGSGALNLNNSGAVGFSGTGVRTLTITGTGTGANTLAAVIGDNSGATSLTKSGAGSWTISGANNYSGGTTISAGTLTLSGTDTFGGGTTTIGSAAGNAVLNIGSGGSVSATSANASAVSFVLGNVSSANGALNLSGTGSLTLTGTAGERNLNVGTATGGYGYLGMSGTTLSVPSLRMGGLSSPTTGTGVGLFTGGTTTITDFLLLARAGGTACLTVATGGTVNHNSGGANVALAYGGGRAELNLTGGTLDSTGSSVSVRQGNTGTATGIVNLNAGTLVVNAIANTGGSAYLNFNGGTLKAGAGSTAFIPSTMTAVNIYSGGATIDTQSYNITTTAALVAPGNTGVTGISMISGTGVNKGSGYIGAPYVSITGGTLAVNGSPATAIANMADDGTGNGTLKVDSITITCPGVYTDISTLAVSFTGGGGSGAVAGTISSAANSSGNLTKLGAGILTLSGANTYTGNTTISAGTLALSTAGSLATGSSISIAAGATFDVSGLTATTYTLGASAGLSAAGTASAATIKGNGIVDLGSRPITLTFDGSHPALTVSQGTLSLGGNQFTVNGTPLTSGTYTIATATGGSITDGGSYPSVAGTAIDGTHYGKISISGGNVNLIVALKPTVTGKSYIRAPGVAVKIYTTDLAATATVDTSLGYTATYLSSDSTTANNVTLGGDSTIIVYPGTAGNTADSFSYTISDGHGGTATGTVSITINNNVTGQASINMAGQTASISFFGIPGYHYVVQRSVDSINNWADLTAVTTSDVVPSGTSVNSGVITAPAGGAFTVTDPVPPVNPTSVFYQLRAAP